MLKWIKKFFGLDYPNEVATGPADVRPPVEDKGEILFPTIIDTRPAVTGKGELTPVKKAPKKAAKKAAKK